MSKRLFLNFADGERITRIVFDAPRTQSEELELREMFSEIRSAVKRYDERQQVETLDGAA